MSVTSQHETPVPVHLICIDGEHVSMGKSVPDGRGTLTVVERRWAYCSAALRNAPHDWKETGGVHLDAIRHADLPSRPEES